MKKFILITALFLVGGCKSINKLTGSEHKTDDPAGGAFYIVACCMDTVNGIDSYPAFLPQSQVQLCNRVKNAERTSGGQIDGNTYLAMNVDCDPKFGHVGSQYYAGKGY